jgi:hypothetical protein
MSNIVCPKCDKDFTQRPNAAVVSLPENHGWPINTGEIDKETGATKWVTVRCGNATSQQVSDYRAAVLKVKSMGATSPGGFDSSGFTKIEGGKKD